MKKLPHLLLILFLLTACKIDNNKDRISDVWIVEKIENDNHLQNQVKIGSRFSFTEKGSFIGSRGKWKTISSDTISIVSHSMQLNDTFKIYYYPEPTIRPTKIFLEAITPERESYQLRRDSYESKVFEQVEKQIRGK